MMAFYVDASAYFQFHMDPVEVPRQKLDDPRLNEGTTKGLGVSK